MHFLQQKINGLKKRWRYARYGITYLKDRDVAIPPILRINGHRKAVHFMQPANDAFRYEFAEICINDCYRLHDLGKQSTVTTIVDIGANQGLFAIAARQHFPAATITCYEPNQGLAKALSVNAAAVNAQIYYEAVTHHDCKLNLAFAESDLHTTAAIATDGNVTGTGFKKVVERAGGRIDLLKMDCEGGEWSILEDRDSWSAVRMLTMEYHLWAKPRSTVGEIKAIIENLGFRIIATNELAETFGLLVAINHHS